jgi:hypothetical protein
MYRFLMLYLERNSSNKHLYSRKSSITNIEYINHLNNDSLQGICYMSFPQDVLSEGMDSYINYSVDS